MERITRRSLMGRALLATAGTSIAVNIPASVRAAAKQVKDPRAGYDPGFVAGPIVTKRAADSFVVTDADGEPQRLHLVDSALARMEARRRGAYPPGDRRLLVCARSPEKRWHAGCISCLGRHTELPGGDNIRRPLRTHHENSWR